MVRTSISSPMDVGDGPGTIGRVCHSTVCTINAQSPTQMDQKVRAARRVGTQGQCTCSAFAVCVAFDVASLEIKILAPKRIHRRRWPAAVPPKPGGRAGHTF